MLLDFCSAKRINYNQMSSIEQSQYVTTIYDFFICVTHRNVRVLSNHTCDLLIHQCAFGETIAWVSLYEFFTINSLNKS